MKKTWLLLIALALVVLLGVVSVYILNKPVIKKSPGVIYDLRAGSSKRSVIRELSQRRIIHHPYLLAIYAYILPGTQIKSGEYMLPKGASTREVWRQFTTGKGLHYRQFMIIPGWSFAQLRQVLAKTPQLKQTLKDLSDKEVMTKIGYPSISPEGQFLPETYFYTKGDSDFSILKRSFKLMQQKFASAWLKRNQSLPFRTPYQALIAASLVEKEAFLDSERPVIAGVIMNRLKKNMLLQIDPSVIFGMGDKYDGNITKQDLQKDTPYNTYTRRGLPPTPIGMPSLDTVNAVLHPETHEFYYFVARGDGSHQFSKTLDEHNAAVKAIGKINKKKRFFNESMVKDYLRIRIWQALA